MTRPKEPTFHCFQDDLDEDDPRRDGRSLYCVDCREMVWCETPGEYMQAWFTTRIGPVCLDCFYKRYQATGRDDYLWYDLDEWVSDKWRADHAAILERLIKDA